MSEGLKFDQGKDPWHLWPTDAARAIVRVLDFGMRKYGPRNWEKGMDWSRPYAALQRHMAAWWEGERSDPETGFSHLWHAGCCIVFLIAYELRHIGTDDRPAPLRPHPFAGDPIEEQIFGPLNARQPARGDAWPYWATVPAMAVAEKGENGSTGP